MHPSALVSPAPLRATRFQAGHLALLALLLGLTPNAARAADKIAASGQWLIESRRDQDQVGLTFIWKPGPGHEHWGGSNLPLARLGGITRAQLDGPSADIHFELHRDAGTFACDGRIGEGRGAGLFELRLDPGFPTELARRGVGKPSEAQQVRLALADAGFALLDELKAQKYPMPDVDEFSKMAEHGVGYDYVRQMGALGYKAGTVAGLIKLRDHGVDGDFVQGLRDAGFDDLTLSELLTARDHGVDPAFIAQMRHYAGTDMTLAQYITVRDHGVDANYIAGMAEAGHGNLPLSALVRARDHGVDPDYIQSMAAAGYRNLELEDLIRARDHGVDAAFARGVKSRLGHSVSLQQLIRIRDQGGLD